MLGTLKNIFYFYLEGFKSMSYLGKTLWFIIIFKLFLMFFVLKLFFFQSPLKGMDKEEKTNTIATELTKHTN